MKVNLGNYVRIIQGFAFKTENYVKKSNWRLVTLGNFQEGGNCFKYNDEKATYYGDSFPQKVILKEGDLVLPLTEQVVGLFGNSAFIPKEDRFQFVLNQRVGKVELLNNEIDKYFLHYLLATPSVKKQLEAKANGTKQRNISPDDIYNVSVELPDINIQREIGKFLYDIEIKQQNNNKINKTLDVLAKTIYDYWFVQFDFPNEEGKPYRSSGGKMVYNEELKREIPEGWEVKQLNNSSLFKVIKTGIEYFDKTKTYLATADVDGNSILSGSEIVYDKREGRANMQHKVNSVWFAKMKNSIKHILFTPQSDWMIDKYILSTGFTGLECNSNSLSYIWSYINNSLFEKTKNYRASGSTQEGISDDDLILFNILEPSNIILDDFNKFVLPILNQQNNIIRENQQLTLLRDFLLPLLMNGQATIKEADNKVEEIIQEKPFVKLNFDDKFELWLQKQGLAARGDIDRKTLREIFDAMDDDDK